MLYYGHGNRSLLADHVLIAHLVAFLSPALTSLRRIEEVFNHSAARRRFGLPEVPPEHALGRPGGL